MTDLELAKRIFSTRQLSFVLVKQAHVLASGTSDGIGELLTAVEALGAETNGASLADKVVGKAVAMVAADAGVRAIYSPLASVLAQGVLSARQISLEAERIVPLIRNKRNDGPCPMERLTIPLDDPRDAVAALREFVARPAARAADSQPARQSES